MRQDFAFGRAVQGRCRICNQTRVAGDVSRDVSSRFLGSLYYVTGDYNDPSFYRAISTRLPDIEAKHNVTGNRVFYLAVPPLLYGTIVEGLGLAGLSCPGPGCQNIRLVVEKPFGRDLKSAVELNRTVQRHFAERQIYRIDHYLGKETVQNIMMLRFANAIFEPVWNRNFVDNIQIKIAESVGVEHRGGYYDKAGALRDVFQNHMLAMLALVAMEPPVSFEADHVRDEKVKLLRCIRPLTSQSAITDFVRGQYVSGMVEGKTVPAYRQEPQVDPNSSTETFVAARLFIDNWRWQDVPFYLRAGKRLATKDTEIAITFKKVPHSMFISVGLPDLPPNVACDTNPAAGRYFAQFPGQKTRLKGLHRDAQDAIQLQPRFSAANRPRRISDCFWIVCSATRRFSPGRMTSRFPGGCWGRFCRRGKIGRQMPYEYQAGCESFPQADRLIESDGRKWRSLWENKHGCLKGTSYGHI